MRGAIVCEGNGQVKAQTLAGSHPADIESHGQATGVGIR
jgi:hypothetical protein